MKKILAAIAFLCTVHVFGQSLNAQVKSVTVFMSGAQLEQKTETAIKSGKQTVVIGGLSPGMDNKSIVVDIEPKSVGIVAVSSRIASAANSLDNATIAALRDSIQRLELEYERNNIEWNVLVREKNTLFKDESIGGTSKGIAVGDIEKAADFFRRRLQDIETRCALLTRINVSVEKRRQDFMEKLNLQNNRVNPPSSEVVLELSCNKNTSATITVKYMVRDAGWAPKYDVRASSINDPVKLIYRANVFNGSGIDWTDVQLSLSTANPFAGAEIPTLERWELRKLAGVQAQMDVMEVTIKAGEKRSDYSPGKDQGQEIAMRTIQVEELHSLFIIATPYSIPSDRKPYTVDVTEYELPARYTYFAIPKLDNDAFLTAKVSGWNKLNLVSGDASIYFNGTYLGQAFINTATQADTLALSLGRDQLTFIQREKESEISERKLIGNNEKETFYFRTTVRNNHDRPIDVTLKDQVPVSVDGDITVESLELDGGVLEPNTGFIEWKLRLQPGEVRTVRMGYSIKTPKGTTRSVTKFRTIAAPNF